MPNMVPTVYVVDDDPSFCRAVERLLVGLGYRVEAYSAPAEFVARWRPDDPGCVILDLRMPELPGLEVQRLVSSSGPPMPVILVSGAADVESCIQAMRAGATDILLKPFQESELLAAIGRALANGSGAPAGGGGAGGRARAPRLAHAAGARGVPAGRQGDAQQADRRGAGDQGRHGQDAPRPRHAETRPGLARGAGILCRSAPPGRPLPQPSTPAPAGSGETKRPDGWRSAAWSEVAVRHSTKVHYLPS